jgi:hypothetical protein
MVPIFCLCLGTKYKNGESSFQLLLISPYHLCLDVQNIKNISFASLYQKSEILGNNGKWINIINYCKPKLKYHDYIIMENSKWLLIIKKNP